MIAADVPIKAQRPDFVEGFNLSIPTEIRARHAPRRDRKMSFRFDQKIIPLDGGALMLRLHRSLRLAVDPQTMQFEVDGWNIQMPCADAPALPHRIARRFLELFSKGDARILSSEEERDWLSVLDQVDYTQFCVDRAAAHYIEGTLLRHTPVCRVEWHDGELENLNKQAAVALACLEPGQRFGAFAKLGKSNEVKGLSESLWCSILQMLLTVDFWNVAQGDCTVLTLPNGELIIIDVGPKGSSLIDYLNDHMNRIDAVVLTHNDADHAGALPSLIQAHKSRIKNFFMLTDRPTGDERFKKLFRAALQGETENYYKITRLEAGTEIWRDDALQARLTTVYPGFSANVLAAHPNETSGIICLEINGRCRIIWPGDSTTSRVSSECRGARPFVLYGPHHGAPSDFRSQASLEAIEDIQPRRAFISVGTTNGYSHPRAKYIRRLGRIQCHVVCSQLTSRCDRRTIQRGDHVFQGEALLGLRPPRKGTSCRGAWRLELHGDSLIPDKWDSEHLRRISQLRRPQCLYGRGWRKGNDLPTAVADSCPTR